MAIDSAPLEGAGRVEDTINLLARAARKVVDCAAELLKATPERVCRDGRATLLMAPSVKAAITPANRPEEEATPGLAGDIAKMGLEIGALHIDRGYVKADLVDDVLGRSGEVVCRPWIARNKGAFPKAAFKINMRDLTITCPAGHFVAKGDALRPSGPLAPDAFPPSFYDA